MTGFDEKTLIQTSKGIRPFTNHKTPGRNVKIRHHLHGWIDGKVCITNGVEKWDVIVEKDGKNITFETTENTTWFIKNFDCKKTSDLCLNDKIIDIVGSLWNILKIHRTGILGDFCSFYEPYYGEFALGCGILVKCKENTI